MTNPLFPLDVSVYLIIGVIVALFYYICALKPGFKEKDAAGEIEHGTFSMMIVLITVFWPIHIISNYIKMMIQIKRDAEKENR